MWPKCWSHYCLAGMRWWQRFLHSNPDTSSNAWTISWGHKQTSALCLVVVLMAVVANAGRMAWQQGQGDCHWVVALVCVNLGQNEELTMDLHVLVLRPSSQCNSRKSIIYAKANSVLISYCLSPYSHSRYFQYAALSKYLFHPQQPMCIFFPSPDLFKGLPAWSVLLIVSLWWHNSTHRAVLQTDRHLTARNNSMPH